MYYCANQSFTDMKKIVLLMTALLLVCSGASAQNSVVNRLKNRAKNAVENNIGNKIEKGINNVLDGKLGKDKNNQQQNQQQEQYQNQEVTQDEAVEPANAGKQANVSNKAKANWNNYDFVAGDEIIFEDTQENEQIGEFPSMWDVFNGYAQITELDGVKCIALADDGQITPLFNDNKPYLTDQFTIEYDVYVVYGPDYETAFNPHSWKVGTYLVALKPNDKIRAYYGGDRTFEFQHQVSSEERVLNDAYFSYSWPLPSLDETRSGAATLNNVATNAWHHVAISFNKRAYKVYFDENRVVNIPNAAKPDYFWISCNQHEHVFFIKNVRIAKGAVPLYDRLASDGKIVTYAITFDTGKATIKPESTGEINRITKIMTDDPTINFEIQGHCDNTGSDKVNDPLSQQRAEAVVKALEEQGVDPFNLRPVGKGSHEPVADNKTEEGRAKNRRVEFIKK